MPCVASSWTAGLFALLFTSSCFQPRGRRRWPHEARLRVDGCARLLLCRVLLRCSREQVFRRTVLMLLQQVHACQLHASAQRQGRYRATHKQQTHAHMTTTAAHTHTHTHKCMRAMCCGLARTRSKAPRTTLMQPRLRTLVSAMRAAPNRHRAHAPARKAHQAQQACCCRRAAVHCTRCRHVARSTPKNLSRPTARLPTTKRLKHTTKDIWQHQLPLPEMQCALVRDAVVAPSTHHPGGACQQHVACIQIKQGASKG